MTSDQNSILIQVQTRHCLLNRSLFMKRLKDSAQCGYGKGDETVAHVLLTCRRWTEERRNLRESVGNRYNDVVFLLGSYGTRRTGQSDQLLDGKREKWKPDIKFVKVIVEFLQSTGRSKYNRGPDYQKEVEREGAVHLATLYIICKTKMRRGKETRYARGMECIDQGIGQCTGMAHTATANSLIDHIKPNRISRDRPPFSNVEAVPTFCIAQQHQRIYRPDAEETIPFTQKELSSHRNRSASVPGRTEQPRQVLVPCARMAILRESFTHSQSRSDKR